MHFWATNGLRRPAWAIDVKEELLFENPYVVVARARHPLTRLKRITPRDLARCDWIMPEAGAPRRQAFARMFGGLAGLPSVSIDDIALDLPQHPGHIRPADPDVAARRPVERERGARRPAVPLAASAPLRRRRQPDRLAPDAGPPAIPPAAARGGAPGRGRRPPGRAGGVSREAAGRWQLGKTGMVVAGAYSGGRADIAARRLRATSGCRCGADIVQRVRRGTNIRERIPIPFVRAAWRRPISQCLVRS
jgi:hypothetical protein